MAQMMLWTAFLNTSVVSIGVLIDTGMVVFLEKVEGLVKLVAGYISEGSQTVDLTSKGGERLEKVIPPVVGDEAGAA